MYTPLTNKSINIIIIINIKLVNTNINEFLQLSTIIITQPIMFSIYFIKIKNRQKF